MPKMEPAMIPLLSLVCGLAPAITPSGMAITKVRMAEQDDLRGGGYPLKNQVENRGFVHIRCAEVPFQDSAHESSELDQDGVIEPKLFPDSLDIRLRCRLYIYDCLDGVAQEVGHKKHQNRHDSQHHKHLEQAFDGIFEQCFSPLCCASRKYGREPFPPILEYYSKLLDFI